MDIRMLTGSRHQSCVALAAAAAVEAEDVLKTRQQVAVVRQQQQQQWCAAASVSAWDTVRPQQQGPLRLPWSPVGDAFMLRTDEQGQHQGGGSGSAAEVCTTTASTVDISLFKQLLKACGRKKALAEAKSLIAQLARHGLDRTAPLGELCVSALAQCGALADAVRALERVQAAGGTPSATTVAALAKACASAKDLEQGRRVHAAAGVAAPGCCGTSDVVVCTALVDMYAKCGSLAEARRVFEQVPPERRDVAAWNAMMAAEARRGRAEEVVLLWEQMTRAGAAGGGGGASPNERTVVTMVQACGARAVASAAGRAGEWLELGMALHDEAVRKGYSADAFVGSSLIWMYGKCGSTAAAQAVLDDWTGRSVVSWNAMLAAYVEQGQGDRAVALYQRMREEEGESCLPDVRTFVSALQACAMVGVAAQQQQQGLGMGKALHAEARRHGLDWDEFVCNALVAMYGKCGSAADARLVFDRMPLHTSHGRSVVTWTSMIAAYVEQGLHLYAQMCEEVGPQLATANSVTLVALLRACTVLGEDEQRTAQALSMAREVHAYHHHHQHCCFVGSALISMYGSLSSSSECARCVFDQQQQQGEVDVVCWNSMLKVHAQHSEPDRALHLYHQMLEQGVTPNAVTFVTALQACGMLADAAGGDGGDGGRATVLGRAKAMHAQAWTHHPDELVFVRHTLVTVYGRCGSVADARAVFDALPQPADVVAWNAIISVYAQEGQAEAAMDLFAQMQSRGVSPNELTCVAVLQACSHTGSLAMCRHIHQSYLAFVLHHHLSGDGAAAAARLTQLQLQLVSALVHAYGKCGSMADAQAVFDAAAAAVATTTSSSSSWRVLWTALIAGYSRSGHPVGSLRAYAEMQAVGVPPDGVTFLALLSACSHAGATDQALGLVQSMVEDHGLAPAAEHYVAVVDVLARAGCFAALEQLLVAMPLPGPALPVWLCLLSACRKHGNVELGERAFAAAVRIDPTYAASYALMWGVYADAGLWERAHAVSTDHYQSVVLVRRQQEAAALGSWKPSRAEEEEEEEEGGQGLSGRSNKHGRTWIEHDWQVHRFPVGDWHSQQHPDGTLLCRLLATLSLAQWEEVHHGHLQ